MAHAATLTGLAESLVTAITGRTADDAAFRKITHNAIKGLRNQKHARTNQYAVQDKLNGLLEKFAVLNRDDLSAALESRLAHVPTNSGWMPEILSLLLELSDHPVSKTVLATLGSSDRDDELQRHLAWEEDSADDPAIWETVERCYHSSEDDELEDDSELTVSTKATSIDHIDPADIARQHILTTDDNALASVKDAYTLWDAGAGLSQSLQASEVAVTRDMLSMFHGLPTDLFQRDVTTGKVSIARRVHISTASSAGLCSILQSAADDGSTLNFLRLWSAGMQDLLYIQSIQAAVQQLIAVFGRELGKIEQAFISSPQDTVLSILDVHNRVHSAARTLLQITTLVQGCPSVDTMPFGLLDAFHEFAAIAKLAGDASVYDDLVGIFLAGLNTYLRPVQSWVTAGTIDAHEEDAFFVEEVEKDCMRGETWHARFQIRGNDHIPKCMQPVADKVFALGKSQSFFQSLDQKDMLSTLRDPSFNLPAVAEVDLQSLVPFQQLLEDAVDAWLGNITAGTTHSLSLALLRDHGLRDLIVALPGLYFSQDGSQFQAFAESLVEHLNPSSGKSWGDQFLLTELAHDTLGTLRGVEPDYIYVYIAGSKAEAAPSSRIRRLGYVHVRYSIPWPIQNITRSSTPKVHAQVLSFILQMHFAAALLSRHLSDLRLDRPRAGETIRLRQRMQCFISLFQSHTILTVNTIHDEMRHKMEVAQGIDAMVAVWAEYEKQLQHRLLLSPELDPLRHAVMRILVLSEVTPISLSSDRAKNLRGQLDKELRFLAAGLRNVNRTWGQSLEMLADRLEWSLRC